MAATFERLSEAAAAHDTSELNDIATLSWWQSGQAQPVAPLTGG